MTIRKLIRAAPAVLFYLLLPVLGFAQATATGNITTSSSDCSIGAACLSIQPQFSNGLMGGSVSVTVTGTWSATLQFEASTDGTTYVAITGYPMPSGAGVTSTTANGTWVFNIAARNNFRVRASALASGTAVVAVKASTALSRQEGAVGGGGRLTANTIPKALDASTLTDSSITDNGTTISTSETLTLGAYTATRVPFFGTAGLLSDDADLTFATDTLSATKVASSSLTSRRVTFATTAGLLVDDADMTFVTDTLTATKIVIPTSATFSFLTLGSIPFAGTAGLLSQDNANFFWKNSAPVGLGIGPTAPQSLLDVQGPAGTGAASAGILTLATKELTIVDGDELGRINFNAPLESAGGDAILAGAAIWAEADDTFSATVNSTELVFGTATTSAAIERMRIDSAGNVGIGTTPETLLHLRGSAPRFLLERYTVGAFGPNLSMRHSREGAAGINNDELGPNAPTV